MEGKTVLAIAPPVHHRWMDRIMCRIRGKSSKRSALSLGAKRAVRAVLEQTIGRFYRIDQAAE